MTRLMYHLKHFLKKSKDQDGETAEISKHIIKDYLSDYPVIIDCGAFNGSDSVEFAKLIKTASIHSFEPVTELYLDLKKRTKRYKNIHTYNIALADKDGSMDFYVSNGASTASSSLLEPKEHLNDHPDTVFTNKITVTTRALDSWAAENNIKKIDMLWLDMQGFELKMLKASEAILNSVTVIHTEVSTRETYKGVESYNEYRAFLESKGFKVVIEAIPEGWDMGNVLFVKDIKI